MTALSSACGMPLLRSSVFFLPFGLGFDAAKGGDAQSYRMILLQHSFVPFQMWQILL